MRGNLLLISLEGEVKRRGFGGLELESSGDVHSALASPSSFYVVEEVIGDIVCRSDADVSTMRAGNFTNFKFEVSEAIF